MANYKGRRPGTRRVVIWAKGERHEWIVEGTKVDGDSFEARKRLELEARPAARARAVPTFSDFLKDHYRPHAETHLKRSTWHNVRIYQVATLNAHFGPKRLSEFTLQDVEAYKVIDRSAGPTAVNNELRVLSAILRYAREQGFPVPELRWKKLPVRGSPRARVWTPAQLGRLFESARKLHPQLLPMLLFLVNTGCRKGEAIAAEWDWVDFDADMLRIPSNEAWQPKNGLPREIPLSDALRAILTGPKASKQWVFPNRFKQRYAEFPKDLFGEIRTDARLTGGVHTLRHTFASHFLAATRDMFLLAQILGHSHQRVTEIYSHLLPDHLARARNAVNVLPQTVAATVAEPEKIPKRTKKTATRP